MADDPEILRQIEGFERSVQEQARIALGDLLDTYGGRVLMWELLGEGMIYRDDIYQGEATHNTAFGLGRRHVGLELMRRINEANPNSYGKMLKEAAERAQQIDNFKGEDEGDGHDEY